jgi:hypothetical protein
MLACEPSEDRWEIARGAGKSHRANQWCELKERTALDDPLLLVQMLGMVVVHPAPARERVATIVPAQVLIAVQLHGS